MSFNPKNLSYESNEPAFLRRLRGEHGDRDSSRHERPLARPKKRLQEGDTEDQPTYVIEGSQDTLSKAEYEALATSSGDKQNESHVPSSAEVRHGIEEAGLEKDKASREAAIVKQQVAGISFGGSSKRRLARVVGKEEEEEEKEEEEEDKAAHEKGHSQKNDQKIRAKRRKKALLSFDEEGK